MERTVKVLDKTIEDYRKSLEEWTGESHYQGIQPIDIGINVEQIDVASPERQQHFIQQSIIKYADRNDRVDPEKGMRDLIKIGHYAGLLYQILQAKTERKKCTT